MSNEIFNPHFMRYAGAPSAYDMYQAQRRAHEQLDTFQPAEKSPDDPDRPSNITRAMGQSDPANLKETDLPKNNQPPHPDDASLRQPAPQEAQAASAPEDASGRVVQTTA